MPRKMMTISNNSTKLYLGLPTGSISCTMIVYSLATEFYAPRSPCLLCCV
ncbi:hypothetical protein DSM110093_03704 (plasmid) [Sulfitobacter sp. DSM 110093]|nr:hypothetical protein DSM110093_03704 [Sulfitobacter sp. DSM 110093]